MLPWAREENDKLNSPQERGPEVRRKKGRERKGKQSEKPGKDKYTDRQDECLFALL